MPLFKIERDSSINAGEDDNVVALRAQGCAAMFANMRWIRSFIDEETNTSTCIYEAECADDLREHAKMAGLSCLRVQQVTEWIAVDFDASDAHEGGL